MGYFGKVSGVTVTGGGAYFPGGKNVGDVRKHRIRLRKTKVHAGHRGVNVIIEGEVIKTDSPPDECRIGDVRAQVIPMGNTMGPINTKAFVLAVSGIDPNDQNNEEKRACAFWEEVLGLPKGSMTFEDVCDRVFGEDGLLVGQEIDLVCVIVETQKKEPFTKHNWQAMVA